MVTKASARVVDALSRQEQVVRVWQTALVFEAAAPAFKGARRSQAKLDTRIHSK